MNNLVKYFYEKITELKTSLSEEELSAICACINDYLESISYIQNSLNVIISTNDKSIIQDELIDIQIGLINHIKPHITSLELPLMKLVNELE